MRAPSSPIQSPARGLLSLLDLKNLGALPDTLMGNVQPILDVEEWYRMSLAQVDPTSYQVALAGATVGLQRFSPNAIIVPQGQVWWVHLYTVTAVLPAAAGEAAVNIAPAIILNQAAPVLWQGLTDVNMSVAGVATATTRGTITARGFWAPPGSELGFYAGRVDSATSVTFTGQIWSTRLLV